ncbi:MAG: serine hydrolase domain-containing protein [Muribaculaceae bacterium]
MKHNKYLLLYIFAIFAAAAVCASCGRCEQPTSLQTRLDSLMNMHYSVDAPGAAFIVAQNGTILYEGYRGLANLDTKEPIDSCTAFNIASISKQFTAVAALQLAQQGKLKLSDNVKHHFPHFKSNIWQEVQLKHLLSHCSGVPDARPRHDREFMLHATDEQSIAYMQQLDSLKFKPGETYDYINPTFDLFYVIIPKLTGLDFEAYQKQHLFDVCGMHHTVYFDANRDINNMAHGYIVNEATSTNGEDSDYTKNREVAANEYVDANGVHWAECDYGEETFFATKADGGIYTTARDFLRWERALMQGKVIDSQWLAKAYTPQITVSGSKYCTYQNRPDTSYGYGWFIDTTPGRERKIYHTGDNGGFQAYAAKYPHSKVCVIMFENRNDINRWDTQMAVERILKEEHIIK